MKYHWTNCPRCGCQVTINWSDSAGGVSGSVRRWSTDRSINDGRALARSVADLPAGGGFIAECVCGEPLQVPAIPDAVSAERGADLRVELGDKTGNG